MSTIARDEDLGSDVWITGREGARRLGIPRFDSFKRVAEEFGIRRLVLPRRFTKYHAGDIEAIRKGAIVGKPLDPESAAATAAAHPTKPSEAGTRKGTRRRQPAAR